jgi:hypothetical protein
VSANISFLAVTQSTSPVAAPQAEQYLMPDSFDRNVSSVRLQFQQRLSVTFSPLLRHGLAAALIKHYKPRSHEIILPVQVGAHQLIVFQLP